MLLHVGPERRDKAAEKTRVYKSKYLYSSGVTAQFSLRQGWVFVHI